MDQDPQSGGDMGPADSFEGESNADALQARIAALEEKQGETDTQALLARITTLQEQRNKTERDIRDLRSDVDDATEDFIPEGEPLGPKFPDFADDLSAMEHPWRAVATGATIAVTPGIVWLANSPVAIAPTDITATAAGKAWIQIDSSGISGDVSIAASFHTGAVWPTPSAILRYCRLFEWTFAAGAATIIAQYQWSDVLQFADLYGDGNGNITNINNEPEEAPPGNGFMPDYSFRAVRLADTTIFLTLGLVVLGNTEVTITSWPDTPPNVLAAGWTGKAWITVDGAPGVSNPAVFGSGADWPTLDAGEVKTKIVYHLFEDGSTIIQRQLGDIHVPRMA